MCLFKSENDRFDSLIERETKERNSIENEEQRLIGKTKVKIISNEKKTMGMKKKKIWFSFIVRIELRLIRNKSRMAKSNIYKNNSKSFLLTKMEIYFLNERDKFCFRLIFKRLEYYWDKNWNLSSKLNRSLK